MAYDFEKWKERIKSRTDLSGYVYHLTKPVLDVNGNTTLKAIDRLINIINERKLDGSSTQSGFIIGNKKAVCFQDAPIRGIAQNVIHEQDFRKELGGKIRYKGIGLAFTKPYIFNKGGRPVIY